MKDKLCNVLGDDILFDGLDNALSRGKELLKFTLKQNPTLKSELDKLGLKTVITENTVEGKTLDEMQSKAKTILTLLDELQNETLINKNELIKLNNIPDTEYKELRFISDYLEDYATNLDNLRNYGLE